MASILSGSTYLAPKLQMKLALWAVWCHCLFAIVADPEFIKILTDLNNKVIMPSPNTISQDIKDIFTMSHLKVALILQVGFFSYIRVHSVDIHTVLPGSHPSLRWWLDIAKCHRIYWSNSSLGHRWACAFCDSRLHKVCVSWLSSCQMWTLTFYRALKAHTGVYLAAQISECLYDYRIQKKVFFCFLLSIVIYSFAIRDSWNNYEQRIKQPHARQWAIWDSEWLSGRAHMHLLLCTHSQSSGQGLLHAP